MQTILLALALMGPQPGWCSEENWDRVPDRCLERAHLESRLQFVVDEASRFARHARLPEPKARPGGLMEANERVRAEVWHLPEGYFQIRIKPEVLRDETDATLTYIAAHEVCHIVNGDASYGIWAVLDREERNERHRWTLACAFVFMGADAYRRYLEEGSGLPSEKQRQNRFEQVSRDAREWLERRGGNR